MQEKKVCLVIGAGAGIGVNVAKKFAVSAPERGFGGNNGFGQQGICLGVIHQNAGLGVCGMLLYVPVLNLCFQIVKLIPMVLYALVLLVLYAPLRGLCAPVAVYAPRVVSRRRGRVHLTVLLQVREEVHAEW